MYSQTIGPRDSPKTAIYKKRPIKINDCPGPAFGSDPCIKKPIATKRFPIPSKKVPYCKIVFLPNFTNKKPVTKVAKTC